MSSQPAPSRRACRRSDPRRGSRRCRRGRSPRAARRARVAQRGRAHAVGAEAHEVVEVEQQVVRADLHRHGPARALLVAHELGADRARDVHDLDADAGVLGEEERPMHRLLLDERRARLVVCERVAAALRRACARSGLQQRVALGVHEHEAADGLATSRMPSRNSASVTCGYWARRRHEGLEAAAPSAHWPAISGIDGAGQRAPEAEVDDDLAARHLALLEVQLGRRDGRVGQRVLDHRRDATGGGRHRAGREVLSLRVARILEVGVQVDRARGGGRARRRR